MMRGLRVFFLLALACSLGAPAAAGGRKPGVPPDGRLISQVVAKCVAALNKNDEAALAATLAPDAEIVYYVDPYRWSGPDTAKRFLADLSRARYQQIAIDVALTANPTKAMYLGGSHAYITFPATYAYKVKGRPVTEDGVLTFVLEKIAGVWKITSLTWGIVR